MFELKDTLQKCYRSKLEKKSVILVGSNMDRKLDLSVSVESLWSTRGEETHLECLKK